MLLFWIEKKIDSLKNDNSVTEEVTEENLIILPERDLLSHLYQLFFFNLQQTARLILSSFYKSELSFEKLGHGHWLYNLVKLRLITQGCNSETAGKNIKAIADLWQTSIEPVVDLLINCYSILPPCDLSELIFFKTIFQEAKKEFSVIEANNDESKKQLDISLKKIKKNT